jgi:hypothetical protein
MKNENKIQGLCIQGEDFDFIHGRMAYPYGCIHGKNVYVNIFQFPYVSTGEKHYLHNGQVKCKWQKIGK